MNGLFAPVRVDHALEWPIDKAWCSWNGLWGGALMGAAISALESEFQTPMLSFNAQFLNPVGNEGTLELAPALRVHGKRIRHAAIDVTYKDKRVLGAAAVLGSPQGEESLITRAHKDIPPPEDCPPRKWLKPFPGGLGDQLDTRVGPVSSNRSTLWTRCNGAMEQRLTSALVAVAADHPAYALAVFKADGSFGVTLDSSLRFVSDPTAHSADAWILVDTQFESLSSRFAIANARVLVDDELVAICTQTLMVRKAA